MPRPSLHAALDDDNAEAAVARALEQRGNVNEKNEEGFSVLMVACSLGLAPVVRMLIGAGAHTHLTDAQGLSAVHLAVVGREASGRQYEIILELLLERSQRLGLGLASARTKFGDMPLHFMAQMAEEKTFRADSDPTLIRMLLGAGAPLMEGNATGLTAQQIAKANGAVSLASVLEADLVALPSGPSLLPLPSAPSLQPISRRPSEDNWAIRDESKETKTDPAIFRGASKEPRDRPPPSTRSLVEFSPEEQAGLAKNLAKILSPPGFVTDSQMIPVKGSQMIPTPRAPAALPKPPVLKSANVFPHADAECIVVGRWSGNDDQETKKGDLKTLSSLAPLAMPQGGAGAGRSLANLSARDHAALVDDLAKILSFSQEPEREASVARLPTWDKAIGDDEKKAYGDISAQIKQHVPISVQNLSRFRAEKVRGEKLTFYDATNDVNQDQDAPSHSNADSRLQHTHLPFTPQFLDHKQLPQEYVQDVQYAQQVPADSSEMLRDHASPTLVTLDQMLRAFDTRLQQVKLLQQEQVDQAHKTLQLQQLQHRLTLAPPHVPQPPPLVQGATSTAAGGMTLSPHSLGEACAPWHYSPHTHAHAHAHTHTPSWPPMELISAHVAPPSWPPIAPLLAPPSPPFFAPHSAPHSWPTSYVPERMLPLSVPPPPILAPHSAPSSSPSFAF